MRNSRAAVACSFEQLPALAGLRSFVESKGLRRRLGRRLRSRNAGRRWMPSWQACQTRSSRRSRKGSLSGELSVVGTSRASARSSCRLATMLGYCAAATCRTAAKLGPLGQVGTRSSCRLATILGYYAASTCQTAPKPGLVGQVWTGAVRIRLLPLSQAGQAPEAAAAGTHARAKAKPQLGQLGCS